jgi:hypothetical protein
MAIEPNKIRFSTNKRVQAGGMAYRGKTMVKQHQFPPENVIIIYLQ